MTRHEKILEYALSSLLRRKAKSLVIIIAFMVTIASLSSVLFLTGSLKTEATLLLQEAPDVIVQRTMAGRHELIPITYAEKIKKIRGVGRIAPRYWGYYYDALVKANYTLMGAGSGIGTLELLEGRLPTKKSECAVGAGVADLRGSGYSGELILVDSGNTGVLFTVTGIFKSASSLITNDLVILTDSALIEFFGFPSGQATDIAVEVRNKSEVATVAAKIKQMFPDSRPITKRELVRTYDMVFNWRSGMMLTVFSMAIIAFCIMAWDKATGISAEEKQEIGILKAIGWDTSDVLALKCWEGLIIALSSFLLGITLAFVHIFFFDAFILAAVIKGWSVLFPAFDLTPHLNLFHIFIMGFLSIAPYMACTVLPTWKAAITDPETVMRG
jgi:lipoprotein-releasing system permease protein